MLDAGLAEADFLAWADGQDLAPGPEDPERPDELAMQLHSSPMGAGRSPSIRVEKHWGRSTWERTGSTAAS